jgi:hypothetical protein
MYGLDPLFSLFVLAHQKQYVESVEQKNTIQIDLRIFPFY